jgi:hypothetical protein
MFKGDQIGINQQVLPFTCPLAQRVKWNYTRRKEKYTKGAFGSSWAILNEKA